MPVHDWERVNAGTFHDFHSSWIIHLKETLNGGLLPDGFYALAEQHAGRVVADVLTLQVGDPDASSGLGSSSVAVVDAPPKAGRKVVASESATYRMRQRSLAIRHVSNHRLIAILEIVSSANKDRQSSVDDFVDKAHAALRLGCHLLIIDLIPSGAYDPDGMHEAIWAPFRDPGEVAETSSKPFVLAAYEARRLPEAYVESVAVGDTLPDMPLFLDIGRYINVPLEATYAAAYRGLPGFWRGVLEGRELPPN